MNIIDVEKLSKAYKHCKAVDNISFSVKKGEIFGMLGPNGAGKTTTIECVTGVKPFDQGTIQVAGLNPAKDRNKLYNKIGVQFQETSYQDKIKVKEICSLFKSLYENPYPYEKLIERFDLKDKVNAYVSKLSGGQKQKLSIILALISNPEIVFLDELTTGLDPEARRSMWEYIKELRSEGRTVFMTTHYMEEAEYLCDRICIMNNGKIIANDTVDNIIMESGIDFEVTFESNDATVPAILNTIEHIHAINCKDNAYTVFTNVEKTLGKIVSIFESKNIPYKKINIKRPTLDDVFIKYIGGKQVNQ